MRTPLPQPLRLKTLAGLLLLTAICGASPQEGRVPRPRPEPPRDRAVPAGPSSAPFTKVGPAPEGRVPRPGPFHTSFDPPPGRVGRVGRVNLYPGTRVVVPPAWERCGTIPDLRYWRSRDLMAEIKWLSRRGFIPVSPIGDSVEMLSDYVQQPAGWRAYGVSVPAGGTLQVEVQHAKLAWFRLMLVDKWGTPGPGMLQAAIAHQPVQVTYTNPGKEATAVYVLVDDPAWWSDARDPYTLQIRRSWDPARTDLSSVKMVAGLWGASPSVSAEFRGPSLSGPAVYPH